MKDDSEVYDVGHKTADVLMTKQRDEISLIKDEEHTHLFWYEPFVQGAMGVEVSVEDKLGLFGDLSSKSTLDTAWLGTLTRHRMNEPYPQQGGSSWP
jgi:hypothetical protein